MKMFSWLQTLHAVTLLSLSTGLGACADDDTSAAISMSTDDNSNGSESTGTSADSDATGNESTGAQVPCVEDDFVVAGPFAGAQWDSEMGVTGEQQESYIAHSTFLEILPGEDASAAFLQHFGASAAQLAVTPGVIGVQFGTSSECNTARTIGLWRSREDMLAYVFSGAHLEAMVAITEFAAAEETTSWTISADELPLEFDEAIEQLDAKE